MFFLFAQTADSFRFDRIQEPRDWFWPLLATLLLLYWAYRRYRKDAVELARWKQVFLFALRFAVIVSLLLFYLRPQWEQLVASSRVAVLIDTSASMSGTDLEDSDRPPRATSPDSEPLSTEVSPDRFDGDSPSRLAVLTDWIDRGNLFGRIREKHDLVVYRFDDSLARVLQQEHKTSAVSEPVPENWAVELQAEGSATRLGDALHDLLQRERGQPLAGILLLSDGGQNAGASSEKGIELAKNARIPVYTIGVGSKSRPINFRITQTDVPERAFPNDPFTVKAQIELQGGERSDAPPVPIAVPLELWMTPVDPAADAAVSQNETVPAGAQKIGGQEVELLPGSTREVEFEVKPENIGKYGLYFKILPPGEDRIAEDNLQSAVVEIVDRKDRILLFAGGPLRDYQFLSNQLYRDKSVTVEAYLPWARPGIAQSVDKILETFPNSPAEMSQYDCVVAFDPDWRVLTSGQIDLLEQWVARSGGGLIVVAGPVHLADTITGWTTDPGLSKIRALYPVDVSAQKTSSVLSFRTDSQPWTVGLTRAGEEAEFLRPADSESESRAIWSEFPGFYAFFMVNGLKPTARLLAKSSSPDAAGSRGVAAIFAEQFYGSGRVFYIGSGELWRLRMLDDSYFEKIYTKIIRHVSQGRLQRRSERGSLAFDQKRYTLGSTATVRASATDARIQPLTSPTLSLDVLSPDAKVRQVSLTLDPNIPGSYSGFIPMLAEGTWTAKFHIPETEEVLSETVQVRMSDLESENPARNEPLLIEIARKTGGEYFDSAEKAFPTVAATDSGKTVLDGLGIRSQQSVPDEKSNEKTRRLFLYVFCGLLCFEWSFRRLSRLL